MDTKCNGWSNYPTWNWKLWMDNSLNDWDERTQEIYENAEPDKYFTKKEAATRELESQLKLECDEYYNEFVSPNIGNYGAFTDIFGWALEQIDFYEIAENMLSDRKEDLEKD